MNELVIKNNAVADVNFKADLLDRFIAYADIKEKSKETYLKCIKQFFVYTSAHGINAPSRETVIAYREELKQTHKPTTVQTYITALKVFFKWLDSEGIYKNVAEHVKGAKLDRNHKKDALTASQAHDVITDIKTDTLAGARDYALLSLMLTTGLRTIEIERANIEDIRTVGDNSVLFIQGKGRDEKNEYVKLAPAVEKAIRKYLSFRGEYQGTDPLFIASSNRNLNGRMSTRSIRGIVKQHLKGAGLNSDRLTAHSLRHTAGTIALLNGASIREVQQLLRHANINTTMIYAHELDRAKNNSELTVANAIF